MYYCFGLITDILPCWSIDIYSSFSSASMTFSHPICNVHVFEHILCISFLWRLLIHKLSFSLTAQSIHSQSILVCIFLKVYFVPMCIGTSLYSVSGRISCYHRRLLDDNSFTNAVNPMWKVFVAYCFDNSQVATISGFYYHINLFSELIFLSDKHSKVYGGFTILW